MLTLTQSFKVELRCLEMPSEGWTLAKLPRLAIQRNWKHSTPSNSNHFFWILQKCIGMTGGKPGDSTGMGGGIGGGINEFLCPMMMQDEYFIFLQKRKNKFLMGEKPTGDHCGSKTDRSCMEP